jgi:hypothetical protein
MAKWQGTVEKTGPNVRLHFQGGGAMLNIDLSPADSRRLAESIYQQVGAARTSASKSAAPKQARTKESAART